MKKLLKLLIPMLIVLAACKDNSTKKTEREGMETTADLYFSEPALYKHHLDSERKAFYNDETTSETMHYKSGEASSEEESPKSANPFNCNMTHQECLDAGYSNTDCTRMIKICDRKPLEDNVTVSMESRRPPKPDPCPEGNCFPYGIVLERGCTICKVKILDLNGEEVGGTTDKRIDIEELENYVVAPFEISKKVKGNFIVEVTKHDSKGRVITYQTEVDGETNTFAHN